jgi:hypothetical protein
LKINKKEYGERNINYAMTLGNLALVLRDLGEFDSAHSKMSKCVRIKREFYGDRHIEFAKALENLSNL